MLSDDLPLTRTSPLRHRAGRAIEASNAWVMPMNPVNPSNPHSDGEKANTPDRHRNDKATWKEHDQPDTPHEEKETRDPE